MILGHNIRTEKGYVSSADRAKDTGADIYQIFYRSPQSYASYTRPDNETKELARRNIEYNKLMVIHGSFIINLCQYPTDYRHYKGINILVEDLNVSVKLNALGVIIHMGKDTEKNGQEISKGNYILGIKETLRRSNPKSTLILETGAGVGTEVSSSIRELGYIRQALTDDEKKRVKFCLDTCHMFAYGYRLDMKDAVSLIDMEIQRYLGWENVSVVHLNDSEDKCNSHKDNHADIGKGNISFDGLMYFVHLCVINKIPMVLETPTHYYNKKRFTMKRQMKLIRTYYDIMYGKIGPNIKVITRTKKHKEIKEMKKMIMSKKNIN
jgi:deoxyribonuclease-4